MPKIKYYFRSSTCLSVTFSLKSKETIFYLSHTIIILLQNCWSL